MSAIKQQMIHDLGIPGIVFDSNMDFIRKATLPLMFWEQQIQIKMEHLVLKNTLIKN